MNQIWKTPLNMGGDKETEIETMGLVLRVGIDPNGVPAVWYWAPDSDHRLKTKIVLLWDGRRDARLDGRVRGHVHPPRSRVSRLRAGAVSALGDKIRRFENVLDTSTPDYIWLHELADEVDELVDNPRDEYHTMAELYEYRMLYNALAARSFSDAGLAVKSWRHHDGELCFGGGWFIVAIHTLDGWVTNHYEAKHWDMFYVHEQETGPEWDGHTPAQAAQRLRNELGG